MHNRVTHPWLGSWGLQATDKLRGSAGRGPHPASHGPQCCENVERVQSRQRTPLPAAIMGTLCPIQDTLHHQDIPGDEASVGNREN